MMSVKRAAWILKNEPWELGNHPEAVDVLRAHRIVVADFGFRVTTGEPDWPVRSIAYQDDDECESHRLYRRAEPEFRGGLFWDDHPLTAWLHAGLSERKSTFYADVPPSALLAVFTSRGAVLEYIVHAVGLAIHHY